MRFLFVLGLLIAASAAASDPFWEPCPHDTADIFQFPACNWTNDLGEIIYWQAGGETFTFEPGTSMVVYCDLPVELRVDCSLHGVSGTLSITWRQSSRPDVGSPAVISFDRWTTGVVPTTWGRLKGTYR